MSDELNDESRDPYAVPHHDAVNSTRVISSSVLPHMIFWVALAGCVSFFRAWVIEIVESFEVELPTLSALVLSPSSPLWVLAAGGVSTGIAAIMKPHRFRRLHIVTIPLITTVLIAWGMLWPLLFVTGFVGGVLE